MINSVDTERCLTIGQVADESGLSVRNIRAYQGRGLLQLPEVRGRTGYYGPEHLERIALIRRFQAEGFNLRSIASLVDGGESLLTEIESLHRDLHQNANAGWVPMTLEGIRLLEEGMPGSLAHLQKIGSVRVDEDGILLTHPIFFDAGWQLVHLGVDPKTIIELLLSTHQIIRRVADVYVQVIKDKTEQAIADPKDRAGVQAMRESFDQLSPPAMSLMTTLFEVVLRERAPLAFEKAVREAEPRDSSN